MEWYGKLHIMAFCYLPLLAHLIERGNVDLVTLTFHLFSYFVRTTLSPSLKVVGPSVSYFLPELKAW